MRQIVRYKPPRTISRPVQLSPRAKATTTPVLLELSPAKPPVPGSRSTKVEKTPFPRSRSNFLRLTRRSCGPCGAPNAPYQRRPTATSRARLRSNQTQGVPGESWRRGKDPTADPVSRHPLETGSAGWPRQPEMSRTLKRVAAPRARSPLHTDLTPIRRRHSRCSLQQG